MLTLIIALCVVIADQVSKAIVVSNIELHTGAGFIPGLISFYHTQNTGAAFSMLSDKPWVFMVLSTVMIAAISWFLYKEYRRHPLLTVALSLILGGGIGNMIDRVRLGYVTDFLRFEFIEFAVFNVADSCITVGAVLLVVYLVFFESKVEKRLKDAKTAGEASPAEGADPVGTAAENEGAEGALPPVSGEKSEDDD